MKLLIIKKSFFLFLFFILSSIVVNSQSNCNFPSKKKVLIVGDSWGSFMWIYRSYKNAFERYGYADYIEEAANTVENGAETEDFMVAPKVDYVFNALNSNPDIEYVVLSLCGNDVLGDWHKDFTQFQCDSLIDTVMARLQIVIDTIKYIKPGIKILMSGYDYTNFGETCAIVSTGAYYDLFHDMGSPSFFQINTILQQLTQRFILLDQADNQIFFVNNLGLMQYQYGQSTNLIVAPFSPPYAPFTVPLPDGNINYPSPRSAMLGGLDAFHLSSNGFQHFANRHTAQFFWPEFRKPDTSFVSMGGLSEGYVDLTGTVFNNQLALGNQTAAGEVSSIFSFNTAPLPDNAVITEARLFLTRSSLSGQNPLSNYSDTLISLDIFSDVIGSSVTVEASDFVQSADGTDIACVVGSAIEDNFKVRFEISDSVHRQLINKNGITQFRLRHHAIDLNASNIIFFHGASADSINRPILDIKYHLDTITNLSEINIESGVFLYPNPTGNYFFIQADDISKVEILTSNGLIFKELYNWDSGKEVNVMNWAEGIYIVKIITKKGCFVRKVVVR
ncbi:MAG: SGNH/GDSL hydrolase family protein [Bacteroidales bacterium]|nr:SGNH/GDSL hydrolase family protein [Bacteroidales bacterium]